MPSKESVKCPLTLQRNFPRSLRETTTGFDILIETRNWTALELTGELCDSGKKKNRLPFCSPFPPHPPPIRAFQLHFQGSLATEVGEGGVPKPVPLACQPFPSLAFRAPHLPAQLARGLCKRQSSLGEAQHLAWLIGTWEASTKSFQTKGINIICGAISPPGAQYGSGSATRSPPSSVCRRGGRSQAHPGPEHQRVGRSPPLPLCAARSLLRLSLSRLNNGWALTGGGSAQGRGLDRG